MKNLKELKIVLLFLVLGCLVSACFQVANSFSGDKETFSELNGSRYFVAVRKILQESCARCHPSFMGMSEKDFQTKLSSQNTPFVTAKNLNSSELYLRLQGAGPRGDMPTNGTLSRAELEAFQDWIMNLEPVSATVLVLPPLGTPAERFAAAHEIFSGPRCVNCHATDLAVMSEEDFRTGTTLFGDPWIILGDAEGSYLWDRLQGNTSDATFSNMPQDAPPPTDIEREVLRRWINEMPP